eukprot:TRINITY_DN39551_c0_g1_i1.p1 TRINITY_DN39551_c0_g1~~TRINITY_DN39551_c0_g1_i1.p1  ORF type:complete len:219 (+),score=28.35 TRINITY_DN39551_c0_g1_i1:51-707(+)
MGGMTQHDDDSLIECSPRWICLTAWVLVISGLLCFAMGVHQMMSQGEIARPATGFCCWRDHPLPYFGGDPCACPVDHRGDYNCPSGGCSDSSGATWQRGAGTPSNDKSLCRANPNVAGWCPADKAEPAAASAPVPAPAPAPVPAPVKGFCCWRDHPIPNYAGDACQCPSEHRGDYNGCPAGTCTDASGITWQRGPGTQANTETFCNTYPAIADWCEEA